MKLKDKLKSIKDFLEDRNLDEKSLKYLIKNNIISHDNLYRFHFLSFDLEGKVEDKVCDSFILPRYLTIEESLRVISFIFDNVDCDKNTFECLEDTTKKLNKVGFILAKNSNNSDRKTVDLFNVINLESSELFSKDEYNDKYFYWYCYGVTREEIEKIYNSHGFDISNVSVFDENKSGRVRRY